MKKGLIIIKNQELPALLAITSDEQSQGLMGVDFPPPNMAFIYNYAQYNTFWMKNTKCPLDIVFCLNGKVSKICKGEPYSTEIIDGGFSDLVLEFPYGTCDYLKIKEKDEVFLKTNPEIESIFKF